MSVAPLQGRRSRHFGVITPPVSGHLHPLGALGRELIERGHRVTVFHLPDLQHRVLAEGLEFIPIGESDHPVGSLAASLAGLSKLQGLAALRYTIEAVRKTTVMLCRDAPAAMEAAGIDALLVDQTEPAGGTIADYLGLPYITVCCALLLNREPGVPPPFTNWDYHSGFVWRIRNLLGYQASTRVMLPVLRTVARYRRRWGLPPHRKPEDWYSPLAQISQQPRAFDFPRQQLPETFHYVGPLRQGPAKASEEFPWHRLNGKPLVYASLGTLQNRKEHVFRIFAEACAPLDVQLVLTHGGGLSAEVCRTFPGAPLIVPYAPQTELLPHAALTVTHAGLNTVLDSLAAAVPLVAIPITYEQPAIASRILWTGTGEVLTLRALSAETLRQAILKVLKVPEYKQAAQSIQSAIYAAGGVKSAGTLIESLLSIP